MRLRAFINQTEIPAGSPMNRSLAQLLINRETDYPRTPGLEALTRWIKENVHPSQRVASAHISISKFELTIPEPDQEILGRILHFPGDVLTAFITTKYDPTTLVAEGP
jgi:hypothetical protein